MLSKTLSGIVIFTVGVSVIWWWLDPVSFAQNPIITFFKGLSNWTPGHR